MTRFFPALIALALSFFLSAALQADELDQLSIRELSHWVNEAPSGDLKGLAQRQFYFEVTENPQESSQDYFSLQDSIARRIPNEFSRPVFDVRFYFGDKDSIGKHNSIGILGGTGPMSDANITQQIMNGLEGPFRQGMVHLFSLPPPRSTMEKLTGGVTYAARLTTFVRHGYADYYLASNTAHLNIKSVEVLATPKKIVNLAELIADRIKSAQSENGSSKVLILGTKAARDGKLYPNIFSRKNIDFVDVSSQEQDQLQDWIDRIKSKPLTSLESARLKQFVEALAAAHGAAEIFLGCTELPLGLAEQKNDLMSKGYILYDSELMISQIITERFDALTRLP